MSTIFLFFFKKNYVILEFMFFEDVIWSEKNIFYCFCLILEIFFIY